MTPAELEAEIAAARAQVAPPAKPAPESKVEPDVRVDDPAAKPIDQWHAFASPYGFKARFPEEPKEHVMSVGEDILVVAPHEYAYEGEDYRLAITFARLPKKLVDGLSPEESLTKAVDGMTKNANVVSNEPVSLGGLVGREFVVKEVRAGEELQLTTRVFVDGPMVYRVDVGSPTSRDVSGTRDTFFGSFELVRAT